LRRFTFTIFAWIVLFSRNANCQTGQLSGTVRDQQGAVIRGAQVTATKTDSGVERSSTTDDAGVFVLPFLSPGLYQVTVKASGFMTTVRQGITVQTGQLPQLDFVLSIGSKRESVTVQGDAPLVQTESGSVSTVIDRNFVADLPLNGRSFSALYLLIPGVQPTPSTDEGQYSVNGQRATSNQYSVDGVSANYGVYFTATLASTAAGGLAGTSSTGGTNSLLSVDALQEFQVQTSSYAPEYGRTAGTQVEIVSRSGTNTFHGTAFDYLRNEALDANDWFNNYNGIARPAHRQNDFGGVLGGPVIIPKLYNGKDKTFFFFSYEGLRLTQPETLQGLVPSLSLRHEAPASMQTLLNMYPLPNGPNQGTTGLANFTKAYSTKYDVDGTSIRIDHRIADNLQFFGRYNHAPSDQLLPQALNVQGERDFSNDAVTAGVTWTITPQYHQRLSRKLGSDTRDRFVYRNCHRWSGAAELQQSGAGRIYSE
jgi:hypothetical protein